MFWKIVLGCIGFAVGGVWCSYGIIMPLIVVRTSKPLIRALDQRGLINASAANARNKITLRLWTVIDIIAIAIFFFLVPWIVSKWFFIGAAIVFLMGIGKTGPNAANKGDFVRSYGVFFIEDGNAAFEVINNYPRV